MATLAEKLKANRAQREESDQKNQKTNVPTATQTSSGSSGGEHSDIPEILKRINVDKLDHDTWRNIGTTYKALGFDLDSFAQWTATTTQEGRGSYEYTASQWKSFDVSKAQASGYIVKIAETCGDYDRHSNISSANVGRPGAKADNSGDDDVWRDWDGNPINQGAPQKPEGEKSEFEPVEFNMADVDPSIIDKPRKWLWGTVLGRGDVMAITGLSGSGKTISVVEIACAAASGGEALGRRFKRKMRVRIFDPEFEQEDIKQRIMRVAKKTDTLEDRRNIDVTCSKYAPLDLKGIEGKLSEYKAKGKEYDLIILDSISVTVALEGLDENSNAQVTTFLIRLRQMCARFGVVCIFMLHPPKNAGQAVQNAGMLARGAEAWRACVDVMAEFRPLRIEEDTPAWELQKAKASKGFDDDGNVETIYPRAFRLVFVKWRHKHRPKDMNMFLRYPIHEVDETGELKECREDFNTPHEIGGQRTKEKFEEDKAEEVKEILSIIDQMHEEGGKATRELVRLRLNKRRREQGKDPIKKSTFETYTKGKNRRLPFRVYKGELTFIPPKDGDSKIEGYDWEDEVETA